MKTLKTTLLLGLISWSCALWAKPLVVTSMEPITLLAQDLYGDSVVVKTLLKPSQDPHHVSLSVKQLQLLTQADLALWLGADAEPLIAQAIVLRKGPTSALLSATQVKLLAHGEGDKKAAMDPHVWLDPLRLAPWLPMLVEAGKELNLPTAELHQRASQLTQQWQQAVQQADVQLEPLRDKPWLSYHQPWRYLQERLHLQAPLVAVASTGGEIGTQHFLSLSKQISQQQVHCAIVEPEARRAIMQMLCQAPNCQRLPLDPLARPLANQAAPSSYISWWQTLVNGFEQCLSY